MASDAQLYSSDGLSPAKRPHACVLVIFGASGDLTKRKLIPALYNLALEKRLPERFAVVGYARSEMSHEEFRAKMLKELEECKESLLNLCEENSYAFNSSLTSAR